MKSITRSIIEFRFSIVNTIDDFFRRREMGATITDIAREAGVSIATVSRVMNGKVRVSDETKQRVRAAMEKFNYSPSMIARGLKNKSMKNIALVVSSLKNMHHMRIAFEIDSHFSKLDYDVVMYETGISAESVSRSINRMLDKGVDGAVFIGSAFQVLREESEEIRRLLSTIPVVIANGWTEGAYGILVDEYNGMKAAVRHLMDIGRRRILYLQGTETISAQNKVKGFLDGCDELSIDKHSVMRCENSTSGVRKCFNDNSGLLKNYDAIICDEDNLASAAIKILAELGYSVPGDKAIIGVNNSEYAELASPGITSIDNLARQQGISCASILDDILSKREVLAKKVLDTLTPELVIRESTMV